MAAIDEHIATYLQVIEIEGKSVKTIASYANTLADFRTIGRRLGFPERPEEYPSPTSTPTRGGRLRTGAVGASFRRTYRERDPTRGDLTRPI